MKHSNDANTAACNLFPSQLFPRFILTLESRISWFNIYEHLWTINYYRNMYIAEFLIAIRPWVACPLMKLPCFKRYRFNKVDALIARHRDIDFSLKIFFTQHSKQHSISARLKSDRTVNLFILSGNNEKINRSMGEEKVNLET